MFSSATGALAVSDQLLRLSQGSSTTSDYTLQFRTLAASSGWNEAALLSAYCHGLNPNIRAAMSIYDDTIGLENFMQRANRISQCLSACQPNEAAHQLVSPAASPPVPEPMQVDSTRLTRVKRTRRIAAGLCLYCGSADHFIQNCPVRPPRPVVSTIQLEPEITTLSLLLVQRGYQGLLTPDYSVAVSALVDSGSSGNFISQDLLSRLHLPRRRHAQELRVETIQGKPLGRGRVRYTAPLLKLCVGCLHEETITFLVLEGPTVDVILGCPWLALHSPEVRWEPCEITRWSEF